MLSIHLLWGCDPSRQYETSWLLSLLSDFQISHFNLYSQSPYLYKFSANHPRLLVESGLHTITKNIHPELLQTITSNRINRLNHLFSQSTDITLFHLSDEEGNDGTSLYPEIPHSSVIYRNFPHLHLHYSSPAY